MTSEINTMFRYIWAFLMIFADTLQNSFAPIAILLENDYWRAIFPIPIAKEGEILPYHISPGVRMRY